MINVNLTKFLILSILSLSFLGDTAEAKVKFQKDELDKATAKSAARTVQRERELEAYKKLDPMTKLAMNPPSQEAIMRARQEWGISGKADWEK